MIRIDPNTANSSYTIDLWRSRVSGETYITVTRGVWDASGNCTGYAVSQIAGPLSPEDLLAIHQDPYSWDNDPEYDLDRQAEAIRDGELVHVEELA